MILIRPEEATIKSSAVAYHAYTDGSTIYGVPQFAEGSRVTDTDIGSFLTTVAQDEMLPQGNKAEAFGVIEFKSHSEFYPGELSSCPILGVSGLTLRGETATHALQGQTSGGTKRPSQPGVGFSSDGTAFVAPPDADVDSSDQPINYFKVQNISIEGVDKGTGTCFDWEQNLSGSAGLCFISNVIIQNFKNPWRVNFAGKDESFHMDYMNIAKWTGTLDIRRNMIVRDSGISAVDGGQVIVNGGVLQESQVKGDGENKPILRVEQEGTAKDISFRKFGGTDGNGTGAEAVSDGAIIRPKMAASTGQGFRELVKATSGSPLIKDPRGPADNTDTVRIASGASPSIWTPYSLPNGLNDQGGDKPRYNGVIGGGPIGGRNGSGKNGDFEGDLMVVNNEKKVVCRWDDSRSLWKPLGNVASTYTGDGTSTQTVSVGFEPNMVVIEESGGDMEKLHRNLSRVVLAGSSMPGSISITSIGFNVGNGTGDQDPNTNGETYQYVVA